MVHGVLEARGCGSMRERYESAAKVCLSQAQAMRQSCSAHLLSIKMVLFQTAAACVHMEIKQTRSVLTLFH